MAFPFRLEYLHLTVATLKVNVKVIHISTVNILKTTTDTTNIAIASSENRT